MKNIFEFITKKTALRLLPMLIMLPLASPAFATAYGEGDDCTDANITSCGHPNVVMISGFDEKGLTVRGTRCSATMIKKPTAQSNTYVFLTAAHCTYPLNQAGKPPILGVSFDPDVSGATEIVDIGHFVVGSNGGDFTAISSPEFKGKESGILQYDYGVLVYTVKGTDAFMQKWPSLANIPVTVLPQDVNFNLDSVALKPSSPVTFSAVGYGVVELVKAPGTGGNAGGAVLDGSTLGTKRVALNQDLQNLRETVIAVTQNPARGFNGTCFGDSGGPNYYTDANLGKILVGVTSMGDAVCRAMGTNARVDIEPAKKFISCVRNAGGAEAAKTCGQ